MYIKDRQTDNGTRYRFAFCVVRESYKKRFQLDITNGETTRITFFERVFDECDTAKYTIEIHAVVACGLLVFWRPLNVR